MMKFKNKKDQERFNKIVNCLSLCGWRGATFSIDKQDIFVLYFYDDKVSISNPTFQFLPNKVVLGLDGKIIKCSYKEICLTTGAIEKESNPIFYTDLYILNKGFKSVDLIKSLSGAGEDIQKVIRFKYRLKEEPINLLTN